MYEVVKMFGGSVADFGSVQNVALGSAKGSERRDFLQEIDMMKKVSEGQNPHVVSMVGCVTVQEPLSLISEFVPFGNLLQYLRTNQKMVSFSQFLIHYTISQASYIYIS